MTQQNRLIGYARVSTAEQNIDLQIDALSKYGVPAHSIYIDKASGASVKGRNGLLGAIKDLRDGDTLVVWKIDRLGRNLSELIQTAERIKNKGSQLVSITEHIDTKTAMGKMMFHLIGMFAQLERDLISERTIAGQEAAKSRGRYAGRKTVLSDDLKIKIIELMRKGLSMYEIAEKTGVSRATLYNHKAELDVLLLQLQEQKEDEK